MQVTVCFMGDGTTNMGQFYEAMNMAALMKLPVVFVVENNNWYFHGFSPSPPLLRFSLMHA